LHHPKYQRAQRRADDRAVATRQQRAADDNRDDRLKLLQDASVCCGRAELEHLTAGENSGAKRGRHEHRYFHAIDRNTDVPRCLCIAACRENPISKASARQNQMPDHHQGQGPHD